MQVIIANKRSWGVTTLKKVLKNTKLAVISLGFIIGFLSFFSAYPIEAKVNRSNVTNNEDKRIILEAAHGAGFDGCNHMSAKASNGITYYENLEAREMINLIAGHLDQAGLKYEISNEIAGDSYFNETYQPGTCSPASGNCCGFRQGVIGDYSSAVYKHVDEVGKDKYLFAFELHFNAAGGTYSALGVANNVEPYHSNGQKIIDAVDSIMKTTNSRVMSDVELFGGTLGSVTQFTRNRQIPMYYLETFFMDYPTHMNLYPTVKEQLALAIANALIEIAQGYSGVTSKGKLVDPFKNFPSLMTGDFTCKAILVDKNTGNLNNLGELLQNIFTIMKIAAPILTIALSIVDYIKAIIKASDSLKKTNLRVIKRASLGIAIFILPYFLDLLFHLFGLYDISRCGIS